MRRDISKSLAAPYDPDAICPALQPIRKGFVIAAVRRGWGWLLDCNLLTFRAT